jgi:L-methionine (R)-S-oxide reductase
MTEIVSTDGLSDAERFHEMRLAVRGVTTDEADVVANLANTAAVIWQFMPRINWAGLYLLKDGELVVGPFQGQPACVRIPMGRGVCGTAAAERRTIRVADVEAFPGHIPCDAASRSEIALPIIIDGELFGVLDVDSPEHDRFGETDSAGLEAIVDELVDALRRAATHG